MSDASMEITEEWLEDIYHRYNKREFVHPDPLEFLYRYDDCREMEIVGLIASSLAYGSVKQILRSVEKILQIMGESPFDFVMSTIFSEKRRCLENFKHRFTSGNEIAFLLDRLKKMIDKYGSMGNFIGINFSAYGDLLEVQRNFVEFLKGETQSTLLPDVKKGSACKRLNLFFRWMVRKDEVDPGCWYGKIPTSVLLIPLDTHMYKFAVKFGITGRKSGNLKTVFEITEFFRSINPEDPTKYDFAITRAGIGKWYEW